MDSAEQTVVIIVAIVIVAVPFLVYWFRSFNHGVSKVVINE